MENAQPRYKVDLLFMGSLDARKADFIFLIFKALGWVVSTIFTTFWTILGKLARLFPLPTNAEILVGPSCRRRRSAELSQMLTMMLSRAL